MRNLFLLVVFTQMLTNEVSAAARKKRCCPHPTYNSGEKYTCCPCDCQCGIWTDLTNYYPKCYCAQCPPPTTTTKKPPSSDCFPSTATVNLENGKAVKMSDLELGDRVQIGESGEYSEVVAFLKKRPTVVTTYKSLRTSLNKTISLTGNHLIYSRTDSNDRFNPIFSDDVCIGDEVLVQGNDGLSPARITEILSRKMKGAYVPITREGNILVDGVLASCYASFDHDVARIAMAPVAYIPGVLEWIFGHDDGYMVFVSLGEKAGNLLLPTESAWATLN